MKKALEWGVEALLIALHAPSELLGFVIPLDDVNSSPTQKYPIILVERWFSRNVLHYFPKKYLEKKGFKVYLLNYPLTKGTFEDATGNLQRFMEENNIYDAILIGISGGATTCLEYLQFLNGWARTRRFISIGGALYGSPYGRLAIFSKSLAELAPGSKYMQYLHSKPIENLDKITTITASVDNLVPTKYGKIAGADNIVLNMVGHNLLHTLWKPTYDIVAKTAEES